MGAAGHLFRAGPVGRAGARLAHHPARQPDPGRLLPRLQLLLRSGYRTVRLDHRGRAAPVRDRAAGLRRPAAADLLRLRYRPDGVCSAAGHGPADRQRAAARLLVPGADAGTGGEGREDHPRDRRRGAHHRPVRHLLRGAGQRPQLRLTVRDPQAVRPAARASPQGRRHHGDPTQAFCQGGPGGQRRGGQLVADPGRQRLRGLQSHRRRPRRPGPADLAGAV